MRCSHVQVGMGCLWACLVLAAVSAIGEDDVPAKARRVFEQHKDATVTVELVVKERYSMSGRSAQERESTQEVTGVVMDPAGLIVTALSSVDPTSMYQSMAEASGMGDADFKIESEVASVKIRLPDNSELEAAVVLRDSDLDLAFLRPVAKPDAPLPYVDFTEAAEPQMLDTLVAINRLGKVVRRAYTASLERVEGIVTKPRTFYIPGQGDAGNATPGCPAFALDGRIVGIAVMRTMAQGGTSMRDSMLVIVLPASDVLEAAAQAPPSEPEAAEAP